MHCHCIVIYIHFKSCFVRYLAVIFNQYEFYITLHHYCLHNDNCPRLVWRDDDMMTAGQEERVEVTWLGLTWSWSQSSILMIKTRSDQTLEISCHLWSCHQAWASTETSINNFKCFNIDLGCRVLFSAGCFRKYYLCGFKNIFLTLFILWRNDDF